MTTQLCQYCERPARGGFDYYLAGVCDTCSPKGSHDRKRCARCGTMQPIACFPIHKSSADGHRHQCETCINVEKQRQQQQRLQWKQRQQQEREQRQRDNALFHAYGYRWKKEEVVVQYSEDEWGPEEQWVLYTPHGEQMSVEEAKAAIALQQQRHQIGPIREWAKERLHNGGIILDTETTGLSPGAGIIEIALVSVSGKSWHSLVACDIPIEPGASRVHGITSDKLIGQPTLADLWKKIGHVFTERELIIYNASFDLALLAQSLARYGISLPPVQAHCLMEHYSAYFNEPASTGDGYRRQKLFHACRHFGIEPGTHRALSDAQATRYVLIRLAMLKGN